jgi:hypothetical protein
MNDSSTCGQANFIFRFFAITLHVALSHISAVNGEVNTDRIFLATTS